MGKKSRDSKGKGKEKGKYGKNKGKKGTETQLKGASANDKRCYYCQNLGHAKAECRQRLRDLAPAEGRPAPRR